MASGALTVNDDTGDLAPIVLIAEDDEAFGSEVAATLNAYGMTASLVRDWSSLVRALQTVNVDIVLLDQWLGSFDALTGLSQLRSLSSARVVIVTANPAEADRIVGLELGADDVLRKPISGREMVARVRAHLRRANQIARDEQERSAREWRIAEVDRTVHAPDNQPVLLTRSEFELVAALMRSPGQPVDRNTLSLRALGREAPPSARSIDNLIRRVRLKLGRHDRGEIIRTVRGKGYQFTGNS